MVGGRLEDGAKRADAAVADDLRADLRHAYERGRLDERARRRRHPIFMTLTFACAAVGLVALVLAATMGSFERGGAMIDNGLAIAANRAGPAARQAADSARQTVRGDQPQTAVTSNTAG